MEKSLILLSFLTSLSISWTGLLGIQGARDRGKCWCKADVPLVIEEMIREFLSKQDPELEESDRNHRILENLGLEGS